VSVSQSDFDMPISLVPTAYENYPETYNSGVTLLGNLTVTPNVDMPNAVAERLTNEAAAETFGANTSGSVTYVDANIKDAYRTLEDGRTGILLTTDLYDHTLFPAVPATAWNSGLLYRRVFGSIAGYCE